MSRNDMIEIACDIRGESAHGLLIFDGAVEVWLPKSQILWPDNGKTEGVTVEMPEWLAENKGLI